MFGAFLTGMLIASGLRSVRARLTPLRTVVLAVFAPLFFTTAGLRIGVLTTTTYTLIVLVAIATSLPAPPLLRGAMRRVEHTVEEELRLREQAT